MNNLNQVEIQNIRHLVGNMNSICTKTAYYKTLTSLTDISDKYDTICAGSTSLKNKLSDLLKEE